MEGVDQFQRVNGHVSCLHLLGHLHVNELHLLLGGGVTPIADGLLFILVIHYSLKDDWDDVLHCMAG